MKQTPFFKELGPLLFGRTKTKQLIGKNQLEDLYGAFSGLIDERLLLASASGPGSRQRKLPLDVTFWAFISQVLDAGSSCRDAVKRIEAWWRWEQWRQDRSLSQEAYCKARKRLSVGMLESILDHLAHRLEINTLESEALIKGRHIKVVDGSNVSMPDTPQLQQLWPQSSGQKPGCGFPIMKFVGIFSLSSGALLQRAQGSLHRHDSSLLKDLWHTFKPGDVVLGDRGFCSYATFALLRATGVDSIMRLQQVRSKDLRQGRGLGIGDRLVEWTCPRTCPPGVSEDEYKRLPERLQVRLVGIDINVPGWRTRRVIVATTLIDPVKYPAQLIRKIYYRRWEIETHFDQIKTQLQLEVLRTKSPEMVEKEFLIGLIAYNLIRALMQRAAHLHHASLESISFKGALDTIRNYSTAIRASCAHPEKTKALIAQMLEKIAHEQIPERPGRSEPRVKKRRPKNYQIMTKPRSKMKPTPHRGKKTEKTS